MKTEKFFDLSLTMRRYWTSTVDGRAAAGIPDERRSEWLLLCFQVGRQISRRASYFVLAVCNNTIATFLSSGYLLFVSLSSHFHAREACSI